MMKGGKMGLWTRVVGNDVILSALDSQNKEFRTFRTDVKERLDKIDNKQAETNGRLLRAETTLGIREHDEHVEAVRVEHKLSRRDQFLTACAGSVFTGLITMILYLSHIIPHK